MTELVSSHHGGSRLPQASSPPLEPDQLPVVGDGPQHPPREPNWDVDAEQQTSRLKGKLIAIAVAAMLALGTFAYFLSPSGPENTSPRPPSEQPSPATPSQSSSDTRETHINPPSAPRSDDSSFAATERPNRPVAQPTVVWPDPPAPPVRPDVGQPRDTASTANPRNTTVASPPSEEKVLFLQRPGVNIRQTPSPTGKVVGTAPKGTRFQVKNTRDDWVEIENGRLKGWISGRFLGPQAPQ
jgi:hypothetical protein